MHTTNQARRKNIEMMEKLMLIANVKCRIGRTKISASVYSTLFTEVWLEPGRESNRKCVLQLSKLR